MLILRLGRRQPSTRVLNSPTIRPTKRRCGGARRLRRRNLNPEANHEGLGPIGRTSSSTKAGSPFVTGGPTIGRIAIQTGTASVSNAGSTATGPGNAGTKRSLLTETTTSPRETELSKMTNSFDFDVSRSEQNSGLSIQASGILSVKGTLKKHFYWWLKNEGNPYILSVVEKGYRLPFDNIPDSSIEKNNASARKHPEFVETAIKELLKNGVVKECFEVPYTVNPLTVAQNKGNKLRLVLDLRTINPRIVLEKTKFEDLTFAAQFFRQHQFFLNFDLKSGYHHIDIFEPIKSFLVFLGQFRELLIISSIPL